MTIKGVTLLTASILLLSLLIQTHAAAIDGSTRTVQGLQPHRGLLQSDETAALRLEFLRAVRTGNVTRVALLNSGHPEFDLANTLSPVGTPAIWSAAFRDHSVIVEYLIDAGADVDAKNRNGTTSAYVAAQKGNVMILDLLIEAGADLNTRSVWSSTLLSVAAHAGHVEVVRRLLKENMSESIDVTTAPQGQTALWVAAHEGHREIVELLIEHNADVHVPDNAGSTPLWAAAQEGQDAIVGLLLEAGANPNATNINGSTALHAAAAFCQRGTTVRLTQSYIEALIMQDKNGHIPADILCIGQDVNLNEYVWMQYHVVPAVVAIRLHNLDALIQWYELYHTLPVLRNRQNLLHVATSFGDAHAVKLLLEFHPEMITERDLNGKKPIQTIGDIVVMTEEENEEILELFADQGAAVFVPDNSVEGDALSNKNVLWIVVCSVVGGFVLLVLGFLWLRQCRKRQIEQWTAHGNLTARQKINNCADACCAFFDSDSTTTASKKRRSVMDEQAAINRQEDEMFEPWKPLSTFQILDSNNVDITDNVFNLSDYESLTLGQRRRQPLRHPAGEGTSQTPSPQIRESEIVRSVTDSEISQSIQNSTSSVDTIEPHPETLASWSTVPRDIDCHSLSDPEDPIENSSADNFSPRVTYMDFEDLEIK